MVTTRRADRQNDTSQAGRSIRRTMTPAVLKTWRQTTAKSTPSRAELGRAGDVFIATNAFEYGFRPCPRPLILSICRPSSRVFRGGGPTSDHRGTADVVARATDLAPHTSERMAFPMADRTGDILLGMLDRPAAPAAGRPLVLLMHGLYGQRNSAYMLNAARHLLDSGYCVLRLNMRGSGPSRLYCREHYHLGRTADFRRVLWQIPGRADRQTAWSPWAIRWAARCC
jgi:predicted alpha/beta-fold hydrolase